MERKNAFLKVAADSQHPPEISQEGALSVFFSLGFDKTHDTFTNTCCCNIVCPWN